jgi:hypothetical protein
MERRGEAKTPSRKLDRLTIARPCTASWGAMSGDLRSRHCASCSKSVTDFRRFTEAEIVAKVEAHRGKLCARLTHDAEGDLVTLPASLRALPPPAPPVAVRRAPPSAAFVLTALLGAASAAPRAAVAQDDLSTGALEPQSQPDVGPETGLEPEAGFEEAVAANGGDFEIATMGVLAFAPDPLPIQFQATDVVLFAIAGETTFPAGTDDGEDWREVETRLVIEQVFRGEGLPETIRYSYSAYLGDGGDEASTVLEPGSLVLVFLRPVEGEPALFENADWMRTAQVLAADEERAYRELLDGLAALLASGEATDEELTDWIVGAVAEPLTRGEMIQDLVARFGDAETEPGEEDADGPAPEAAPLDEAQRERLREGLLATRRLEAADLELFRLVRRWAPAEARTWLREASRDAAREAKGASELPELWVWRGIAEALGDEDVATFVAESIDRIEAGEPVPEESGEPTEAQWAAAFDRARELGREMFAGIAERLERLP